MKYQELGGFFQKRIKDKFINENLTGILNKARSEVGFSSGTIFYSISAGQINITNLKALRQIYNRYELYNFLKPLQERVNELLEQDFSAYIQGNDYNDKGYIKIK